MGIGGSGAEELPSRVSSADRSYLIHTAADSFLRGGTGTLTHACITSQCRSCFIITAAFASAKVGVTLIPFVASVHNTVFVICWTLSARHTRDTIREQLQIRFPRCWNLCQGHVFWPVAKEASQETGYSYIIENTCQIHSCLRLNARIYVSEVRP